MGSLDMDSLRVNIRSYEERDHQRVCRVFRDGILEDVLPAYWNWFTSSRHLVLNGFLLTLISPFTSSIFRIICIEVVFQSLIMGYMIHFYWIYTRVHLNSDMKDKAMSYWTGQGEDTAGFYVAEVDGQVVGTVAYTRVSHT